MLDKNKDGVLDRRQARAWFRGFDTKMLILTQTPRKLSFTKPQTRLQTLFVHGFLPSSHRLVWHLSCVRVRNNLWWLSESTCLRKHLRILPSCVVLLLVVGLVPFCRTAAEVVM
eukprot:3193065-Amphidinium_carterae.1